LARVVLMCCGEVVRRLAAERREPQRRLRVPAAMRGHRLLGAHRL